MFWFLGMSTLGLLISLSIPKILPKKFQNHLCFKKYCIMNIITSN